MPYKDREKRRAAHRLWKKQNREKWNAGNKRWRDKSRGTPAAAKRRIGDKERHSINRQKCIAHYSSGENKCACCGEDDARFLTIDHVNNDGCLEVSSRGRRVSGVSLYRRLVKRGFPKGFRVLCFNCNCGRETNGGICPHIDVPGNRRGKTHRKQAILKQPSNGQFELFDGLPER